MKKYITLIIIFITLTSFQLNVSIARFYNRNKADLMQLKNDWLLLKNKYNLETFYYSSGSSSYFLKFKQLNEEICISDYDVKRDSIYNADTKEKYDSTNEIGNKIISFFKNPALKSILKIYKKRTVRGVDIEKDGVFINFGINTFDFLHKMPHNKGLCLPFNRDTNKYMRCYNNYIDDIDSNAYIAVSCKPFY